MTVVGLTMRAPMGVPVVQFGLRLPRGLAPPAEQRRRRGLVPPSQWCADDERPPGTSTCRRCLSGPFQDHLVLPARSLLDQVAAGALSVSLAEAGRSAVVHGRGVVGMNDRGLAPRGGAHVVAQHEHPAQQPGEQASSRVHRDQVTSVGARVQPPQPDPSSTGADRASGCVALVRCLQRMQPSPRDRGRDGPVAGYAGRLGHRTTRVAGAERGPVGYHQVDLHRGHLPEGATGQQTECGVGRDRTHPATVRGLVRALPTHHAPRAGLQRSMRTHDVLQGPEHTQVGHPVGCRPHRHPPGPGGSIDPGHHAGGVQLRSHPRRRAPSLLDPQSADHRCQPTVDLTAVLAGQSGSRLDDRHGDPLGHLPTGQGGHHARHLVNQRPAQSDETVPQRRGHPAGQGHLGPHRARHVGRCDRLPRTPQRIRGPRLGSGRGPLDPLQRSDQVDTLSVRQLPDVDAGQPLPEARHRVGRTCLQRNGRRVDCSTCTRCTVHVSNRTSVRHPGSVSKTTCGRRPRRSPPVDKPVQAPPAEDRLSGPAAGSRRGRRTPAAQHAPGA